MKVAIATLGRFHVLDLARELSALGHEVRFYSYVPRRRAVRFGLPAHCHVPLLPFLLTLVAAQRALPKRSARALDRLVYLAADRAVMLRLEPCDVFIGMSGIYLEAAKAARSRYGARIFLERGSRHILSQKEILSAIPGADTPPSFAIARELEGYDLADRIVIPSRQAEASFLDRGVPQAKLFRNMYGVNLEMFQPTHAPAGKQPLILYVGAWSLRKGVDLLVEVVKNLEEVRLLHVGELSDTAFPRDLRFMHRSAVPQWVLRKHYAEAHLFLMASREEGLALVQAQALSCGLPVVCTDKSGGEDLADLLRDRKFLAVVPADDAGALAGAVKEMLPRALGLTGERDLLLEEGRRRLSWRAYGERYAAEFARH